MPTGIARCGGECVVRPGPLVAGDCPRCWIAAKTRDEMIALAKAEGMREVEARIAAAVKAEEKRPPSVLDCPHRGEPTGETVACQTCKGKVMLRVYRCAKNGRCVLGGVNSDGIALCDGGK